MDDILVPLGFFALVAYIAKLIADTRIRRKAMDRHTSAEVAEAILNHRTGPDARSALKWGLVVLSLGAAFLLVESLALSFESPLAYALLLLATGGALLGYYLIEHNRKDPGRSSSPEPGPESDPVYEPEP